MQLMILAIGCAVLTAVGWDVWGRKYTLLGLLHQYDATHDRKLLEACLRMLDHLASQTGPGAKELDRIGNYRGMPSLSVLEPVMWLYGRTGAKLTLVDFASAGSTWDDRSRYRVWLTGEGSFSTGLFEGRK